MRFLCLHGRGTNSNILETQLTALRSRLNAQHTFDFVDAEGYCPAAPGIAGLYPAPYFCWYERGNPEEIKAAHEYILSIVDEDGPYDGVIGFSEGAALAASLLLWDESSPSSQPPFKMAILFNSVVPLAPTKELGEPLIDVVQGHEHSYLDILLPELTESPAEEQKAALSQAFCFSPDGPLRISIPTIHVVGSKDPFVESSRVVINLCKTDISQVLLHSGKHELPQDGLMLDRCAELIETAVLFAS